MQPRRLRRPTERRPSVIESLPEVAFGGRRRKIPRKTCGFSSVGDLALLPFSDLYGAPLAPFRDSFRRSSGPVGPPRALGWTLPGAPAGVPRHTWGPSGRLGAVPSRSRSFSASLLSRVRHPGAHLGVQTTTFDAIGTEFESQLGSRGSRFGQIQPVKLFFFLADFVRALCLLKRRLPLAQKIKTSQTRPLSSTAYLSGISR